VSRTTRKPRTRRTCACTRCQQGRQAQFIRATLHAVEDIVAETMAEAPAEPTGGVDAWGVCWGTQVGADPDCGCFTCDEVWYGLAWPLLREQVTCHICGGDCRLD
jgi:hypothetical protein